jgi:hypothetical protein
MSRLLWIAPYLGLLLTGCDTTILVASGKEFREYQKSIKAYGEYWVKEGMTVEQWREDWVACGGMKNGSYGIDVPSGSTTQKIQEASRAKARELDACMASKSYYWVGSCRVRQTPTCVDK